MQIDKETKKVLNIITFILFLIGGIIAAIVEFSSNIPIFVEVIGVILLILGFCMFVYVHIISPLFKEE